MLLFNLFVWFIKTKYKNIFLFNFYFISLPSICNEADM